MEEARVKMLIKKLNIKQNQKALLQEFRDCCKALGERFDGLVIFYNDLLGILEPINFIYISLKKYLIL
jgi:hypothetical protein